MTFLFVEDDDQVSRAVQRLARECGHELRRARSPAEAMEALARGGIDAVLADWDLDGENGLELLERVRLHHPEVRRVLVSGSDPPAGFADEPPCQLYFAKPFGRPEFASLCAMLAGEDESVAAPPWRSP